MIVPREGQEQPRLVFDYHWVYEDQPGNWMHNQEAVYDFLSNPSHKLYFQFDIKHAYWSVPIHPNDRYLLAFSVLGIGQFQPTRMPQGERSASFTITELMHIALGAIPPPNPEPSLMYGGERPDVQHCSVFMDDGFVITNGQMVPCHGSSKGKGCYLLRGSPGGPAGKGSPMTMTFT